MWPCVKDKMWLYTELLLSYKMSVPNLIDYYISVTLNWTSFVARLILGLNLCVQLMGFGMDSEMVDYISWLLHIFIRIKQSAKHELASQSVT